MLCSDIYGVILEGFRRISAVRQSPNGDRDNLLEIPFIHTRHTEVLIILFPFNN